MKKIILPLIVFLSIMVGNQNAIAVKGGDSAIGDPRVVALIQGRTNNRASCSGALLTPRIVVSAAHCLRNEGMTYSSEIYRPSNLWVSQPGVDLNIDDTSKRVKVVQVILTNGYAMIRSPESNNNLVEKDDIAFFFLAAPLVENYSIEIASEEEIRSIKSNQLIFTHFGYGQQDLNIDDGRPYTIQLQSYSSGASRWAHSIASEEKTVSSQDFETKSLCPGDSGGPWYANIGGVQKIVAVTHGGSGNACQNEKVSGTFGTAIAPYLSLLNSHLDDFSDPKFLVNSAVDIQAKIENPPRGWAAWINSFEYIKGPNPLVSNSVTTVLMKGSCTNNGQEVQAWKNTGTNGASYSNGMRPITPKWKCINGAFSGEINLTGNTKMYIVELPASHGGTQIYFRTGQLISRYNLSDPVDYVPPVEPRQLPNPSIAPPVIKSLKYVKGGNPPTVYKSATIEVSGSCSEAGKSLELYWKLVSENSPTWTLVKKDILCDLQYFKVQSPAFPGLQFKVREYPSLNYSQPFKLPSGKLK